MSTPPGPPPSYATATSSRPEKSSLIQEDDERRLPQGWIRRTDNQSGRHYYIDTSVDPPRSIWHHPLDDEDYLDSLVPANDRSFDDQEHENHYSRQSDSTPYPDELPPRDQSHSGPSPSDSNGKSNSGFSGWARRFGNGMEDNFRYRHGMQPRAGATPAMHAPNGPAYYDERGYNDGPDVVVVGRGRHGHARLYVDDGYGYGRMGGRRRRGGIIRTAITAAMVQK